MKSSSPKSPRKRFSYEEDQKLLSLVDEHGENDWILVASKMKNRDARQCRHRFKNYLVENHLSLPWTEAEDNFIVQQFRQVGSRWVYISKALVGRTGNDVKNRWHKHLSKRFQSFDFNRVIASISSSNNKTIMHENIVAVNEKVEELISEKHTGKQHSNFLQLVLK
ncbi:Transcription factor WER [Tritrichomonas foetus]|uniref:Transcription factor WER n=1 Tax=Tritrichomonas foetus TaxID=1144522 RepID=A0A1J4KMY9_9EUKA|nr:Transcription factor WER [Tritrichomonas foetus]|eukprot:OHT12482.1 Transcription factor WER [Tritrichomonas foetus]